MTIQLRPMSAGACTIKNYGSVVYGLRDKLVRLFKLVCLSKGLTMEEDQL
jgi:hypothetical protein